MDECEYDTTSRRDSLLTTIIVVIVTYDNQKIQDNVLKEKLVDRLPVGSRLTVCPALFTGIRKITRNVAGRI
jgi:hypothetical protein